MRTLLISANTETINMPTLPMGLGCVAAALEAAGHAVRFLDLMGVADWRPLLAAAVAEAAPEVIGISIRNIDDQSSSRPRFLLENARAVVADCRERTSVPVVLGGAGYSIFPESVLDYTGADMGIQGEGEAAFPALLARLEANRPLGDVPGLYRRGSGPQAPRTFIPALDAWPLPAPGRFHARVADDPACYVPIQTRRGCPLKCSYCSTPAIEGPRIRKRSPDMVVASLARWRAAGFRRVYFVDNVFNLPAGYALELCRRMAAARLDLSWRCILYPGRVGADLVQAMARAGCREAALGFESGSRPVLEAMHKRFRPEDVARTSGLLADNGIGRMGFLLLGGPGETRETVEESLAFADGLKLEAVKLTVGLRIYPGTALARHARREGVIAAHSDLLHPRFYIAHGLEDGLRETVRAWVAERPHWRL
jgi:radical SAM superfamily enzyme YgiQ (UPF0313 family)